jgi:RNA recognition motif-containing protein
MDIYIKNLHPNLEEEQLRVLFEPFGEVLSTTIVRDKETRLSKGYGFVKMFNAIDAQRAIDDMNGRLLGGKNLVVSEAIPKDSKPDRQYREVESFRGQSFSKTKRDIDSNGWASVNFEHHDEEPEEELSLKVVNEAKFSKTVCDDGYIRISFEN